MTNKNYFKEKKIDNNIFVGDSNKNEIKYGLPQNIEYCKKCLTSNQRPTTRAEHLIKEDKTKATRFFDGVCEACLIKDKMKNIDWKERESQFRKILDKYRSKNGSYDVVVPGSGGKDSFYVAHKLKHEYGMNPITVTFSPFLYTDWGWKNLQSWTQSGFENYLNTPNQKIYRLLARIALENMFHSWHPWILGQKCFPPKFGKYFNVPLVIYGDSPSEYGSPLEEYTSDYVIDWHTCKSKKDIFISGESLESLNSFGIKNYELEPFTPLTEDEFIKSEIKCLAYSYFHEWHPQENYYYTVQNSNFKASDERTSGTYSKYASIDDKLDDLYFYTYFIKFGIGRTTSDVSQEIRNGDISIDEGKKLIGKFDGEYPERFSKDIFEYLSIKEDDYGKKIFELFERPNLDKNYFNQMTDYFRSPHLWKKTNKGMELRYPLDEFFKK
ncbi:N-acetyl sugar amidotransferase [Pelagibacteraceae bacterium]|mgnify:FL=1|jgi:N-acetyl sugar amidotransferase|nr:N-acetyl sugar amidotransferase [Pelagibacteraceae bacterium]